MTKDVMIRIKGLQYAEGQESDTTELMLPGQFFERDGLSFVKYDEIVEDGGETIRNLLKFSDTKLTVIRHGAVESSMSFEKGKKAPEPLPHALRRPGGGNAGFPFSDSSDRGKYPAGSRLRAGNERRPRGGEPHCGHDPLPEKCIKKSIC